MKDQNDKRNVITQLHSRSTIREQAAEWLVRVDRGALSDVEIAEFKQWVSRSELNRTVLRELAHDWDSMDVLTDLAEMFPLSQDRPMEKRGSSRFHSPVYGIAVAAVLVLAVFMLPQLVRTPSQLANPANPVVSTGTALPAPFQVYSTNVGEQRDIKLADGSVIRLNTQSRIRVAFSAGRRSVELSMGEANFKVAKDASRPFIVETGHAVVEAVGTAFNIANGPSRSEVIVTEGKVKVYKIPGSSTSRIRQDAAVILESGRSVIITNYVGKVSPVAAVDLEQKLAWQNGSLIFRGETLEQALAEISRYTDQELMIADPEIRDLRIGGHFKTDDIDVLIDTLSKSFDLTVKPIDGNRILLSRR